MRSLVCALVLVGACSKPGGVVFVIDAGAVHGVATVRVFVGLSTIDNVDSLTVPDGDNTATRTNNPVVAARDHGDGDLVHSFSEGTSFELQTGDSGLTNLPAVIVVGYSENGTGVGAALLQNVELHATNEVDKHDVTLGPVIDPSQPTSTGMEQLYLWGPDGHAGTDAECVGLIGSDGASTFIVAAEDIDCDGFANTADTECDPLYFKDPNGTASLQNPTCLITSSDGTQCNLGAEQCVDGVGPVDGGACLPTDICMPLGDCGCPDDDLQCLIDNAQDKTYLGYQCSIGTNGTCAIPVPRPPTGGFACKPTDGANSATGIASKGDGSFSDTIQIGSTMYKLDVTVDCAVTLTPQASGTGSPETGALLRIDLENGASLITPIDFKFMGSMCEQSSCQTFGFDDPGLTACMAGWQPGAVVPLAIPGRSPTLVADATQMLFIGVDNHIYSTTLDMNGWTSPTEVIELSMLSFLQVHLTGDGMTLYAVDTNNVVLQFVQSNGIWSAGADQGAPLGLIDWFSPDKAADDVVFAQTNGLDESRASGGLFTTSMPIGTGTTPFLSDDALDLYYADSPEAGVFELFVSSRADPTMPFPPSGVAIQELGMSMEPQGPWVSPDNRTMYYVVNHTPDGSDPQIYVTTR
jgi:hypothetical protein